MKLAIVTHNVIRGDGQSRVSYEIARHALKQGVPVTLLADAAAPELQSAGANWIPVQPQMRRPHLFKVRQFAALADKAIDRLKGDTIQAFGYVLTRPHHVNNSQFVHGAWGRSPVHTARIRHDLYGAYQRLYTSLNTRWEQQAYRQARVVVPSSRRIEQQLCEINVTPSKMKVILNGVDLQEFYPGRADRTALGLPLNIPLALFAGDIRTPRKNLDTVLKAVAGVPGVHLAVVGAVSRSPYPAMAARLGLTDRVHFLDFRRDIPDIMRASDLFVFPSRYEACSLVILEALASGLPVITAETAGGAEIVTPDCGIVLTDPNDRAALVNGLQRIVHNSELRSAMGQAARQVAEKHSWTEMADAYLRVYHSLDA